MHVVGVYVHQRPAGARAAAVLFQGRVGTEKQQKKHNCLLSRRYKMEAFQICDPSLLSALEVILKNKCFPFLEPEISKGNVCVCVRVCACVCLWFGLSGCLQLTSIS